DTAPARVSGHYQEVNTGSFDLADGIAYGVDGATVVHLCSTPVASSVLARSGCPMTRVKALEMLRSSGFIEMTVDPRGRPGSFGAGTVGGGRSIEQSGSSWTITGGKVKDGRIAGRVDYPRRGRFDFDLPLTPPGDADVRRKPSEKELILYYEAL